MILHPDDSRQMFFGCRADWVADEPLVTVVEQVVSGLDLDVLYSRYSFRSENLDLLDHYSAQIVSLCERSGLLDVSVLAVDSTKIRSSASGRRAVQRRKLDELARRYQEELSRDAVRDDSHEEAAESSDSQPFDSGDHGSEPNVEEPDIKRSEVMVTATL